MRIVFLVGSVNISGGTYVIFEHATRIKMMGHNVYILTEEKVTENDISWHINAKILDYITYDELEDLIFDIAIATWWKTIFSLHKVYAKRYIYFVQSIESRFYPMKERALRQLVESTYTLNLPVITEATWIKKYLKNKYLCKVDLVHNGIRKDLYSEIIQPIESPLENGLRVLVEGPLGVDFKNVEKTISLCKQSMAKEIWLLTSTPIKHYKGVDKVFSQVPINEAAKIYRSCDLVVKLSYVEGMFGPPLEMFHCGGTAIVYNVTGHDEYIIHNYNALVIEKDDEEGVINAINDLVCDPQKLEILKTNAKKTANNWIDWEKSSELFYHKIEQIFFLKETDIDFKKIGILTHFHEQSYIIAETSLEKKRIIEIIRKYKIKLKNRFPLLYAKIKQYYYRVIKKPFATF